MMQWCSILEVKEAWKKVFSLASFMPLPNMICELIASWCFQALNLHSKHHDAFKGKTLNTIVKMCARCKTASRNIPAHQMCFLPPTIDYFFFWHFTVISLTEHQRCVRLWSKFIFSWYMAVLMCSLDLRGQYHLEMSQIWGLMHPCMSFCIL